MRVVSGSCKGRQLKSVPGKQTRPTTDKVKAAIFNMIGPYFDGGMALDLFAGSGALGIEGLSRGLQKVIFVERDVKAFQIVKENVKICGFDENVEIYRNVAEKAVKAIMKRELTFDYIFLDPPYKKQQLLQILELIDQKELLSNDGKIVCEHGADVQLAHKIGTLVRIKYEVYGAAAITIYRRESV